MTIAIMQPYFCAYIGYYQLINSVDKFIIYDNIRYTKKGWFNRNRILVNGTDKLFTIPVRKDSYFLNVNERFLAKNSLTAKKRIISQISNSYKNAPYYSEIMEFTKELFLHEGVNLFDFIYYSVIRICTLLDIDTEIIVSSALEINHNLTSQNKVLEICKFLEADRYINAAGGKSLYSKEIFKRYEIDLKFIKSRQIEYHQFNNVFIPWLSIIDVLMFNGIEKAKNYLTEYDIE